MDSEAIMKLPIIDFSNLKQETPTWESVRSQVRQAFEEYGCFEATLGDQIPLHLQKSVFDGLQQIFDLPLEIKKRNKCDQPFLGYAGKNVRVPLYESLGIDDALSPAKIETFTNQIWPQGDPSFSKNLQSFSEKLSETDKIVRTMVLESLGLEEYMDDHMDSTKYIVRIQKYDVPRIHDTEVGLVPHTDKNIITISFENEVNGLQVMTKDGEWITAQPSPNSIIVMVGQSFHAWTNGRLHCPLHRVMMSGDKERYSIILFSTPLPGYIIKAPEQLVDEDHPLLFKPFDQNQFLQFLSSETGRTSPDALKAYCGA